MATHIAAAVERGDDDMRGPLEAVGMKEKRKGEAFPGLFAGRGSRRRRSLGGCGRLSGRTHTSPLLPNAATTMCVAS